MSASNIPKARAKSPARDPFVDVMMYSCPYCLRCGLLNCSGVGFAGADAHGAVDGEDKDFAVADLAGFGGAGDGADDLVNLVGRHRHLDFHLGKKAHRILGATVDFRVPLLTPVTFDLGDGHSRNPDCGQSVADLVELER